MSDSWVARRADLENLFAIILPAVKAGNIKQVEASLGSTGCTMMAASPYRAAWYELTDSTLPDDSVAVIRLRGMIYAWTTEFLINYIRAAESNPKICGIVLDIDGPGGMISHIPQAARAIERCTKPVAAVCTGTMASAHFWLGSAAAHTFVADSVCEVGCVGVVSSLYSFKRFLDQNGIDFWEIYPDSADLKNIEVRKLVDEGDESLVKENAERLNRIFCNAVSKHLNIGYDPKLPLFRGAVFAGEEAVQLGYINELGGVDEAVIWVLAEATSRKASELY